MKGFVAKSSRGRRTELRMLVLRVDSRGCLAGAAFSTTELEYC